VFLTFIVRLNNIIKKYPIAPQNICMEFFVRKPGGKSGFFTFSFKDIELIDFCISFTDSNRSSGFIIVHLVINLSIVEIEEFNVEKSSFIRIPSA